jgi:phosphinothricin acetyltransferase
VVIAVRPAEPSDASAIAGIYRPYVESGTVSFETKAPDTGQMRSRMLASDGFLPWLVVVEGEAGAEGTVIGYAYATPFRDRPAYRYTVETSVYLAQGTQGKGNGRQLYHALIDTVRTQGFAHAISVLTLPNDWAIRLHESVGFKRTGVLREAGYKDGRWIDVGFWQCELNQASLPPLEPKAFRDVGMVSRW